MEKMDPIIPIREIRSGMKNINVYFIVLEIQSATKTKENREVFSFKVADSSACINCSIWDEPGRLLQPGDIVRMMKCYANMWRGCLTLYSGKSGEISRVGDFCMVFNEIINMSEPQPATQNSNAPAVIPNSATNGNGRTLERNNSQQPSQQAASSAAPPSASSNNSSSERAERSEKSKVSGSNSQSKGYMRRPINKK